MACQTKGSRKYSDDSLVWGGCLYYNPKKPRRFNKSHRCWCELHREVSYYPRELRFYAKRPYGAQKIEKVTDTIPLRSDVIKVMSGIDYDNPKSFKIVTSKTTYVIGTDTPEEAESWTYAVWKELYGPVIAGVVYNFNVEVEQNRTTQKYNVAGSYLLQIFDDKLKLFTPNGQIPTQFEVWIRDIVKASSPPVYCLSLAVLNISTSDVGGDVMLFIADCARDIVRIINHRRELLLGGQLSKEFPQPFNSSNVVPIIAASSATQPHYPVIFSSSGQKNLRSSTNPQIKRQFCGVRKDDADASKPRIPLLPPNGNVRHMRKFSEPAIMTNQINLEENEGQFLSADQVATLCDTAISMRGPAPLPRLPTASLGTAVSRKPLKSQGSVSSTDSSDSGYVIESLTPSYLKLYPQFDLDMEDIQSWKRGSVYAEYELNYSDSELLLSKHQKRLSKKSKRLSRKNNSSSHRRSTVSNDYKSIPGDLGGMVSSAQVFISSTSETSSTDSHLAIHKKPAPFLSSSLVSKRQQLSDSNIANQSDFINYKGKVFHCISDSNVIADSTAVPVHKDGNVTRLINKHEFQLSDNESNLSDGELWLSNGQKRFSRKSKRMSKKRQKVLPKVKPATFPKPISSSSNVLNPSQKMKKSISDDIFKTQQISPFSGYHRADSDTSYQVQVLVSAERNHCAVGCKRPLPLPQLPTRSPDLLRCADRFDVHCKSDSGDMTDAPVDSAVNDGSNQSDSELLLSNVQRHFCRRSKKLSKKQRNQLAGQNCDDLTQTKSVTKEGSSCTKLRPVVAPRTAKKPVVPLRKVSPVASNEELQGKLSLSPALSLNSDECAVNSVKDDTLNRLDSSLHIYSTLTNNGPLPSLPLQLKTGYHRNLSLETSGSFDDLYSPDHTYSYPHPYDWMNGEYYDSDSQMWFGRDIKKLSMRCKRYSRKKKNPNVQYGLHAKQLSRANDGVSETSTSKAKPNTTPRLYKPEVLPRSLHKQEVGAEISAIKECSVKTTKDHGQHRKQSDELPLPPSMHTCLSWPADEDKTFLRSTSTAAASSLDEDGSGSGYVINSLDYTINETIYVDLGESDHIYTDPIFSIDELQCKVGH